MSVVNCTTHGSQKRTRVCTHIVDTLVDRKPRGMYWTSDDADEPNAWCSDCNASYEASGEDDWSDELMVKVDPQILCFACFKLAQRINGFGVMN